MLSQVPDRIWFDVDYEDVQGVLEVDAEMRGAKLVRRIDDLDRDLIAEVKARESAARAPATP